MIDKIISQVLQHEINGSRLLQVTERDLQNLSIEPEELRQHIIQKINELQYLNISKNSRSLNHTTSSQLFRSSTSINDFLNFPLLKMSAEIEAYNVSYLKQIIKIIKFFF